MTDQPNIPPMVEKMAKAIHQVRLDWIANNPDSSITMFETDCLYAQAALTALAEEADLAMADVGVKALESSTYATPRQRMRDAFQAMINQSRGAA